MRNSGEAQCPSPKFVEDPTDYSYSIQDVFKNICGLVEGCTTDKISVRTLSQYSVKFFSNNNLNEQSGCRVSHRRELGAMG